MQNDPLIDVLDEVVKALERCGITYAVTGSVVSGIFGEPVTSQDVDLIVRMDEAQARKLHSLLPQHFYRSADSLLSVARSGGIANLIEMDTCLKVDLSVPASDAYFNAVFARRGLTSFGEDAPSYYTVSPEDIVLMKLLWRKETESTKQWANALSVARVQGGRLDWKYLFEKARELGLENDLVRLRDEAGI